MPLLSHTHELIEIRVADRVIDDTVICQVARFVSQRHSQAPSGECTTIITVSVTMHSCKNAEPGEPLTAVGFSPREYELTADNNTIVDAETGEILAIRTPAENPTQWLEKANSYEQQVSFQGDYFERMRKELVAMAPLIRQHIRAADLLMHKFA